MTTRILIAMSVIAAAGCKTTSRNDIIDPEDRPSLAVPTGQADGRGGGPLSTAGALNILADARCEREAKCGMLGESFAHADRATCERDSLQAHAADVALLQCQSTLDAKKVAACAEKLRTFACDRDARPAAEVCGAAKLCTKD